MHAVEAGERRAATAKVALIAGRRSVIKIVTAGALQQVAPVEAILRSCADAPAKTALASIG